MYRIISILAVLLLLAGCATNPVTGESQFSLYGEEWEHQVGAQQYAPMRQAQGGDLVIDESAVDYVQSVGRRIAQYSDRELPYEFQVINSSVPNAWALPGGKLAINRGLLTELGSEAELAAVLGHEIVHAAARHSAHAASRAALAQGAVILGTVAVGASTEDDQYTQVAMLGGMIGAQLIQQRYSRDAEREADYYGMKYMKDAGYDPAAAVDLQETFVRLSENRQSGWLNGLFASHPPSPERVENNRKRADELGRGGRIGREEYQQQMAYLQQLQPAYEAHDDGRKALQEGNVDEALAKAREALAVEDGEALFHALRGDALATREDFAAAERAFSAALERDSSWFYHHLRRGMVRAQREQWSGARSDLKASLGMLPTADGHLHLGNIERATGNRQQAIEHYRTAAQSDTPAGERARQHLVEMGAVQSQG
ncbi:MULTISPECIES: M48 family metalloprotease [unclassified Wenzhouxiangella]|uniref:M48 family metalloprotease n=1 Tax=unclassified Wenzhouxiangella TaxID=2613841 RepID=UPI000E32527A|nr:MULTISPECIES: M48 family metalloprotease [unclassified Wenzhouxiangella]RFF26655.1 peptidase M48 [Wenzhouxiangella sp. 15181]RFP67594.1 peptidase M48 [Wenzhouxiangella sp. 15190]